MFDEPHPLVAPGQTVALYDAARPDAVVGAAVAVGDGVARPRNARYAPAHGGRFGATQDAARRDGSRSCAGSVAHHDERYYQLDSPEITDADYDALIGELRLLEDAHPELVSADSPTRRVAGRRRCCSPRCSTARP